MRRPRLSHHVLARHHRVADKRLIVLHDTHSDAIATVGEREFTVLRAADGTRDIDGIVAACAAEGRPLRADHVSEFLAELERAGMLREGIVEPPRVTPPLADRPRLALEGFRLHCDGSGTCCRIYPTTAFSAAEVARAESLRDAEFTPEHGSSFYPWLARSVAMVDGRCAFLSPDGACVLHRDGGARSKPSGCRMYPAVFVDDGDSLRVTAAPECRCVFASARSRGPHGVPLVELFDPQAAHVELLPAELPLTTELTIDRARANAISDEIYAAASASDAVALLDGLAEQFGASDELARMARRLDHYNAQNTWRSESDFARAVPRWMRAALDRTDAVVDEEGERFYVRAIAFGRLWFRLGEPPFAIGLRRRAARLWIARRLRADPDDPLAGDRALDEPIALVEAICRSFGL